MGARPSPGGWSLGRSGGFYKAPLPPPPLRSGAGTFPPTLTPLAEGDPRLTTDD